MKLLRKSHKKQNIRPSLFSSWLCTKQMYGWYTSLMFRTALLRDRSLMFRTALLRDRLCARLSAWPCPRHAPWWCRSGRSPVLDLPHPSPPASSTPPAQPIALSRSRRHPHSLTPAIQCSRSPSGVAVLIWYCHRSNWGAEPGPPIYTTTKTFFVLIGKWL
jgi:hypothetical protein